MKPTRLLQNFFQITLLTDKVETSQKPTRIWLRATFFPSLGYFVWFFKLTTLFGTPFWALKKCRKELEQNISAFLWDKDENYWWEDGALRCHIINQRILRWKSSKLMHQKVSYLIQMHWWKKVSRWI